MGVAWPTNSQRQQWMACSLRPGDPQAAVLVGTTGPKKCGQVSRLRQCPIMLCLPQEYIGRERTSEAAPGAGRQAVEGGCQSGWGRLLSVTTAIEPGTWRQGDSGWA